MEKKYTNELVSIIMPTYNSEKFILKTIESVINQSYKNWELIITDDHSTDNTVELIKSSYVNENRIRVYPLSINQGAAVARNNSIKEAKGRYIAFLDSDDIWFPRKLEKQLAFMQKTKCDLTYSSFIVVNEKGEKKGYVNADNKVTYKSLLKRDTIGCLTVMYDTAKNGKVYMPLIRKRQDWALWLNILKQDNVISLGIKDTLAQYTLRQDSLSSNKIKLLKYTWQIFYKIENMSIILSVYHFILFLWYYLTHKFRSTYRTPKNRYLKNTEIKV